MPVDLQPRIDKQIVKLVRDQPINFFRHCPVTGAQPRLHVARMDQLKVAPVMAELKPYTKSKQTLIDTGQHYDFNMSDIFFQQLEIPATDVNLGVGSGSHACETAEIITRFEPIVLERKPDLVPLRECQVRSCGRPGVRQTHKIRPGTHYLKNAHTRVLTSSAR
ncbi:MAG: UDP-N-acetylglucosamine 2-epimerase [Terriglobales bacterium]